MLIRLFATPREGRSLRLGACVGGPRVLRSRAVARCFWVEIITGVARRRRFRAEARRRRRDDAGRHVHQLRCPSPALPEPGVPMEAADDRRRPRSRPNDEVVAASDVRRLEERVRDLERLLRRSRSSRKRSSSHAQKKRSRCRALRLGTVPDESRNRHARRRAMTRQRRPPKAVSNWPPKSAASSISARPMAIAGSPRS